MAPRTLFIIIIKVIGIYLLFTLIEFLPQVIETLFFYPRAEFDGRINFLQDAGVMVAVLAMVSLTLLCFYKPNYIIDKLLLVKDFPEERIELNIHRSTVLTLGVIIAGCFIFINALPPFMEDVFEFFRERNILFNENPGTKHLIYYGAKISIGLIMITNCRLIVNQIERKRRNVETGHVSENEIDDEVENEDVR